MPSKTLAVQALAPFRLTLSWLESDQHVRLVLGFRIRDDAGHDSRHDTRHDGYVGVVILLVLLLE